MIEKASEFGASAAVPLVTGDSTFMSAGDMLREAREAHGLHIDMVAAALKVSTQKLDALEADDIDALPDPVFARALAASVCRALRIDPAPVLAKLPGAQPAGLAQADRTISKNLRSRCAALGRRRLRAARTFAAAAGRRRCCCWSALRCCSGCRNRSFDRIGESVSQLTAATQQQRGIAADGGRGPPAAASRHASSNPRSAGGAAHRRAGAGPRRRRHLRPRRPPASPAVAGASVIVFVAREDSWVTVNEASGKSLLRRTVQAGETVGLTGALPLSVVVGRASGVDVQVRGKPFDLAPLTRSGGVARFEVKP